MRSSVAKVGGRPAQIAVGDIVAAGREIGMRSLSLHAVASKLNVSSTALYRHVKGRWDLERLVGESLLAELVLTDDPSHDVKRHLLDFGEQLLRFTERHPGLGTYLQVLFPRGDAGSRLLAAEVNALGARGYSADAAMVLCSAVATLTISLAAREDCSAAVTAGDEAAGFAAERQVAEHVLAGDPHLGAAHLALPKVTSTQYARFLLAASIAGLVAAVPPGRPVDELLTELRDLKGKDT